MSETKEAQEFIMGIGNEAFGLLPLMEACSHSSIKGHLAYRQKNETFVVDLLRYVTAFTEKERIEARQELVDRYYGGEAGLQKCVQAMVAERGCN